VVPSCVAELRVSYDDDDGSDGRRRDALLVFVGGTAGRSVLLEVIEVKRRQQQQQQQPMTMTMMDVDADFYGSGEPGESDQDALRLAVADELLGTGPAAALEVGVKAGGGGDDESLELVTCAGNEWRGRLRVQQRHVAPTVVAALDVPGAPVRGVWTARCVAEYNIGGVMQAAASGADAAPALLGDRFLVVSRDASTAAFAVSSSGDELSELDHRAGFFTRGATVAVAELRACTRVVQVHARGMRVVAASGRETQAVDVATDADAEIVAAEVADPLVLLRLASGAYAAYEAAADSGELRPVPVPADALRRAVHVSLFRDVHRVLDARPANDNEADADADAAIFTELGDSLYADDNDDSRRERKRLPAAKKAAPSGIAKNASAITEEEEEDALATPLYAAVLHASGDLGIVRLPAFAPVWTARRFDCLPATLVNSAAGEEPEAAAAAAAAEGMRIDQVRLALLGGDSLDSLHLVALTTAGELAVYRAFSYAPPPSGGDDGGGCCALRFARVAHDVFAYVPEYERRVLRAQRRQLATYAAWSEADKERLQERAADERLARERALEKQRREDAAAVADW
ncbi:mRNA cleavage and polyadenylation factor subunit, partial [Coemansia sp. RSA 2681]